MESGGFQSTFGSDSIFPTYKHPTFGSGDTGNNGSLPQHFIPSSDLAQSNNSPASYMQLSTDENFYDVNKYTQSNIINRNLTENEFEEETCLQGLMSNILKDMNSLESYYTDRNSSTSKPVWSPKMLREGMQQCFEPESKVMPSCAFPSTQTFHGSFTKAQGPKRIREAQEICQQQVNGFTTSDQWSFSPYNGDTPSFNLRCHDLPKPPGLPMPSGVNSLQSKLRQSNHEIAPPDQAEGLSGPMNHFYDVNDTNTAQSKISNESFNAYYENYSSQNNDMPRGDKQYSSQEVNKLVSNIHASMVGEQGTCNIEPQNMNSQARPMHYEGCTVEQKRFPNPKMHTLDIHNEQKEVFRPVQRGSNDSEPKQLFQGDFRSNVLSKIDPQHIEYLGQSKPLSSPFNLPPPYQNKMATQMGNDSVNTSLSVYLNSQLHSQLQSKCKEPRVNGQSSAPAEVLFRSVSELALQHPQDIKKPPLYIQYQRVKLSGQWQPGESELVTGLNSLRRDGGLGANREKDRMHVNGLPGGGFPAQHLDGNTAAQISTHISKTDKKHRPTRKSYFDLAGSIYGSRRFGGDKGTARAGPTQHFLPVVYPHSGPRQSSSYVPVSSLNLGSRSSLSCGNGVPRMESVDMLPERDLAAFNHFLSDQLSTSSSSLGRRGDSHRLGMTPALGFSRVMLTHGGAMSQLSFYLEECYGQCRCLEKERKKAEVVLAQAYPGKQMSMTTKRALPRVPPNPSKADHLIVDQMREQVKVVSLLDKMEHLRSFPLHANIQSALDRHHEAIFLTQAKRKEEFINMSLRQRQGRTFFRDERDVLVLALALRELSAATRNSRTATWCALQMTTAQSVQTLDDHVNIEGTCE